MGNVLTYLDWRGDLPLSRSPFNEVDNLILCLLSYLRLEDIVPESGQGSISIRRASDLYFGQNAPIKPDREEFGDAALQWLLYRMAQTVRFGDMRLHSACSVAEEDGAPLFFALTVQLDRTTHYIVYRGTTDDLAGWKEDFLLGCRTEIPSHRQALEYLERVAQSRPRARLMVGGHSKGGNLAVYASAHAAVSVRERIIKVWSNDGPGFLEAETDMDGYAETASRLQTIVPKSSIVGMLLDHGDDYRIVDSSQRGFMQHDGFSWRVLGTSFVTYPARTAQSVRADAAIRSWLKNMDLEERTAFVDGLFELLSASGAATVSELRKDALGSLMAALPRVRDLSRENREHILEFIVLLRRIERRLNAEDLLERGLLSIRRNENSQIDLDV